LLKPTPIPKPKPFFFSVLAIAETDSEIFLTKYLLPKPTPCFFVHRIPQQWQLWLPKSVIFVYFLFVCFNIFISIFRPHNSSVMFAGIPVAQLNMATGNAAHLFYEVCQTSENSEFTPLTSAKHLIRARATEKLRHTKLTTKINNHIDNRGSKTELAVHRTSLVDQLEECITTHEKYINAADFNEDENVADEWIRKAEAATRSAYERIDLYLRTPRTSSVRSSVVDEISLPQSLNLDNRDQRQSSVGTSVSRSQRQPNASILATVNEVHERLRKEIDLRCSAEVQLARVTATMERAATDAENFQREIQRNIELQRQLQKQTEQMARDKKRSEEAEIYY
jgi:hypothetical protein